MSAAILRYTLKERIVHWIAGLSYVYLLLTGLAFWSPRMFWLAELFGGGPTVRAWHPWAGLIFTASVVWMFKEWRDDMRTTAADREWGKAIVHYVRNEDENLPKIGRFNLGQKQFFWIMFWSAIALTASGLALWFTELLAWPLQWLRHIAILVHVVAFLFSVGAFIVHVYMGTAVVRGGFTSIIRGEVSREWAETHHALWLAQVTHRQAPKK